MNSPLLTLASATPGSPRGSASDEQRHRRLHGPTNLAKGSRLQPPCEEPHPPLVTVVIPAWNASRYIQMTVESLGRQTYERLEIVIVDDGSTDDTAEVVRRLAADDARIRLIQQSNSGVAAARNRGIEAASGRYIAFIDADDIWFPTAVERLVTQLEASGEQYAVAYAWFVTIDERGELDGGFRAASIEGAVLPTLVCHNFIGSASATLMRRSCLDDIGGFDCRFYAQKATGCEDWDLYLKLATKYKFCVVPEFLVGYRKHLQSMSSDPDTMLRSHEMMLRYLRDRGHEIPTSWERFSRSSLSLYLSREAARVGRQDRCWSLLKAALLKSPASTLLRASFYAILLGCLLRGGAKSSAAPQNPPTNRHQRLVLQDIARRRMRIGMRVTCQQLFHRWMILSHRGRAN